jgi:hypothetical protein
MVLMTDIRLLLVAKHPLQVIRYLLNLRPFNLIPPRLSISRSEKIYLTL